ncbi:hypothetical protein ARMGADRAFT_134362 [Armillaria gallica]|uniref:Uncharacterized protein n=1 Tax=Armillaria gallica TaxID=47427 RepID=A0A2H3C8Q9_ARMGA|nr:hypothetical protein ARMGADRAFT_134362 [Armillaria gallica]
MARVPDATRHLSCTLRSIIPSEHWSSCHFRIQSICGRRMPQTPRQDHDGSSHPEHPPSRIKLWLNQLWPHSGTNEGVTRLSGDSQV